MNSFKKVGGLQYSFRTITKEQAAAELAEQTSDDVIGLTADQSELRNRSTGEQSQKTDSTSHLLADALKRVSAGKGPKKPDLQVTERKANAPAPTAETSYTPSETSEALAKALSKLRS
jgi:response regulator RpfG family c-di-GMP phosphodiesterase